MYPYPAAKVAASARLKGLRHAGTMALPNDRKRELEVMLYFIYGRDAPESLDKRLKVRARHLERVQALLEQGRLRSAGPLPAIDSLDPGPAGFVGSLILADFPSLQAAEAWAKSDPYIESGAWAEVHVHPYKEILP